MPLPPPPLFGATPRPPSPAALPALPPERLPLAVEIGRARAVLPVRVDPASAVLGIRTRAQILGHSAKARQHFVEIAALAMAAIQSLDAARIGDERPKPPRA